MAARFSGPGQPYHGLAKMTPSGPRWTGKVELVEKHLADPLRWKKTRRVFVNSMSDLFHEALPDEAIDRVFAVMALAPKHTFQILTKRPERMLAYFGGDTWPERNLAIIRAMIEFVGKEATPRLGSTAHLRGGDQLLALPNVWLGVSVEDQATANERIPLLLSTPAAVRFVSYEPALGPVDFERIALSFATPHPLDPAHASALFDHAGDTERLDWIIVGGESGPHARPFDLAWARSTVAQCKAAGVACFVKQLGGNAFDSDRTESGRSEIVTTRDRKGGDISEWPKDLRVREFPK